MKSTSPARLQSVRRAQCSLENQKLWTEYLERTEREMKESEEHHRRIVEEHRRQIAMVNISTWQGITEMVSAAFRRAAG